ncbi:MAG: nitroreductase family protein [Firmicutes bacterium]|nr:nitroreductase family protein [Bacillota bacterium]
MEVFEAIAKRRSIRKYVPMPVPEDKLRKVLEAAQAAPSASNRQEYKLIVVTEEETKRRLVRAAADQGFLAEAGAVIVACATDPSRKWHAVDIAIAIDHMTLAALELGLGTCWIGAFEEEAVKSILGVPDNVRVVMLLTLGIPAEEGRPRKRKPLEELVLRERWQD